jgi:amino acid adenylation domain-containing protein
MLALGRCHFSHRFSTLAETWEDIIVACDSFLKGTENVTAVPLSELFSAAGVDRCDIDAYVELPESEITVKLPSQAYVRKGTGMIHVCLTVWLAGLEVSWDNVFENLLECHQRHTRDAAVLCERLQTVFAAVRCWPSTGECESDVLTPFRVGMSSVKCISRIWENVASSASSGEMKQVALIDATDRNLADGLGSCATWIGRDSLHDIADRPDASAYKQLLHLPPVSDATHCSDEIVWIEDLAAACVSFERSCTRMLMVLQSIAEVAGDNKGRLPMFHLVLLSPADDAVMEGHPYFGMVKSALRENARLRLRVVVAIVQAEEEVKALSSLGAALSGVTPLANLLQASYVAQGPAGVWTISQEKLVVSALPTELAQPGPCKPHGTWLITGGCGALGLATAQQLSAWGADRILLLSRRTRAALPEVTLRQVDAIPRTEVISVDVADPAALEAVLLPLGPVMGIVHAAGVLADGPLKKQTLSSLAQVGRAKIEGMMNFRRFLQRQQSQGEAPPVFIAFSSLSGQVGSPGQVNYAAANATLDAVCAQMRKDGLLAISIAWGPWAGGGMAAGVSKAMRQRAAESGLDMLTRDQGMRVFQGVLASLCGRKLPSTSPLIIVRATGDGSTLAEGLETRAPASSGVPIEAPAPGLEVEARLARSISRVLGLPLADVVQRAESNLLSLGLDSLLATDLQHELAPLAQISLETLLSRTCTLNMLIATAQEHDSAASSALAGQAAAQDQVLSHKSPLAQLALLCGLSEPQATSVPGAEAFAAQLQTLLTEFLTTANTPAPQETPPTSPSRPVHVASYNQQAMWYLWKVNPHSAAYNICYAGRCRRSVQAATLRRALLVLLGRHAQLRAIYDDIDGRPRYLDPMDALDFDTHRLPSLPSEARVQANEYMHLTLQQPFDLSQGPCVRARLLAGGGLTVFQLCVHHINADFIGLHVATQELGALYAQLLDGGEPLVPAQPVTYQSFVRWQQQHVSQMAHDALEFWTKELEQAKAVPLPPALAAIPRQGTLDSTASLAGQTEDDELAFLEDDRTSADWTSSRGRKSPAGAGASSTVAVATAGQKPGDHVDLKVPAELDAALQSLAEAAQSTMFGVWLALYQIALFDACGESDLTILCPTAGRPAPFRGVVGNFVNPIPVRHRLNLKESLLEHVQAVQGRVVASLAHRDTPFAHVVKHLRRQPGAQGAVAAALSDVALNFFDANALSASPGQGGRQLFDALQLPQQAEAFALMLHVVRTPDHTHVELRFRNGGRGRRVVERMADVLKSLLHRAAANPDVPLGTAILHTQLDCFQRSLVRPPAPHMLLHTLARSGGQSAWPAGRSQVLAAVDPEGALTHAELWASADRITSWLLRHRRPAKGLVGVWVPKGRWQLAAVLGVLQAGLAYVPLSPAWPVARLQLVLQRSQLDCALVLVPDAADDVSAMGAARATLGSHVRLGHVLQLVASSEPPVPVEGWPTVSPQSPAYVLFTSGSTGTPKGVVVPHEGACNTLVHIMGKFGLGNENLRVLALSDFAFDLSVFDLFAPLSVGGCVVFPTPRLLREPRHWLQLVEANHITVINCVPTFAVMLAEFAALAGVAVGPLRAVLLSGDVVPVRLAGDLRRVCRQDLEVVLLGGVTEVSIWTNFYRIRPEDEARPALPYGRALPNQFMVVLDADLHPCPVGQQGQIYYGGPGLALGYFEQPELTRQAFVRLPNSVYRLYATGDRGRLDADGLIYLLGRMDHQVKVGGHRIELGDIEACMQREGAVRQACALAVKLAGAAIPTLVAIVAISGVEDERPGVAAQREGAAAVEAARALAGDALVDAILTESLAMRALNELPSYMVPQHVFILQYMPLNSNGKIDRKMLTEFAQLRLSRPAVVKATSEEGVGAKPPAGPGLMAPLASAGGPQGTPANRGESRGGEAALSVMAAPSLAETRSSTSHGQIVSVLRRLWCEGLHVRDVEGTATFGSLGGDSVLAAQLSGRAYQLRLDMGVEDLEAEVTFAECAQRVLARMTGLASSSTGAPPGLALGSPSTFRRRSGSNGSGVRSGRRGPGLETSGPSFARAGSSTSFSSGGASSLETDVRGTLEARAAGTVAPLPQGDDVGRILPPSAPVYETEDVRGAVEEVWALVLGGPGALSDPRGLRFQDLGGDSVVAVQMMARLQARGIEVSMEAITAETTLEALVALATRSPVGGMGVRPL